VLRDTYIAGLNDMLIFCGEGLLTPLIPTPYLDDHSSGSPFPTVLDIHETFPASET